MKEYEILVVVVFLWPLLNISQESCHKLTWQDVARIFP